MLWSLFFRVQYRLLRLVDPVLRWLWRRRLSWFARIVSLSVPGRSSGRDRRTLVTLLTVDGRAYVGHPNGAASWTRNLEAAGEGLVVVAGGRSEPQRVRAIRLFAGPEREAVIRATWSQQPFPGNVVYAMARRHVRAVGVYFRLNSLDASNLPDV